MVVKEEGSEKRVEREEEEEKEERRRRVGLIKKRGLGRAGAMGAPSPGIHGALDSTTRKPGEL